MDYNAAKILKLVNAIQSLYGFKAENIAVIGDTAAVVHKLWSSVQTIELAVDEEAWSELSRYHKPVFTSQGCYLKIPNVVVYPMNAPEVPTKYLKVSGVGVADLESLGALYNHRRNRTDYYEPEYVDQLDKKRELVAHQIKRNLTRAQEDNQRALIQFTSGLLGSIMLGSFTRAVEKVDVRPFTYHYKDASHTRYRITLNEDDLVIQRVDLLDTELGKSSTIPLDLLKELSKGLDHA